MTLLPILPHLYLNHKTSIQVYEKFHQRTINDYISPQIIFRVIYYHEDEIDCPICLEHPILPRMDKCGHIFCLSCLLKLCSHEAISAYVLCPLCKSCQISAKSSKRVDLRKSSPPQVGQHTIFRLLAKGKQSKYPDYYDNLPALCPYAPLETDPVAAIAPISVISDKAVLKEIQRDKDTIMNSGMTEGQERQYETETLKFLTYELLEFRSTIENTPANTNPKPRNVSLDCFNFLIEVDRQLDRFDLLYQNLVDKHVLLEPSITTQLITRHKNTEKGLLAEIYGQITGKRTITMTPSIRKESHLSHIPLGATICFITINLDRMWYAHSSGENYQKAKQAKDILDQDATLLAKSRRESQEKQIQLKARGETFVPMATTLPKQATTSQPNNDYFPSSFNLCMLGLECDDPDDDYPHDVMCYRYHDAYRRREFEETTIIEEDSS